MKYFSDVDTPLGIIRVITNANAVIAVGFNPGNNIKLEKFGLDGSEPENNISREASRQLIEYFSGKRKTFDLPVNFGNISAFSRDVLHCLQGVPYGELLSYGALADLSGRPKAARAVGRVMAANPIPIIVPCHRIVGSNGNMTGYSGGNGITTKEWILAFEREKSVS